jgi:hypothetical protein
MTQPEDDNDPLYFAIGKFMFWFSRLEFTIKACLAASLNLREEQFDTVVSPYDFVVLCSVAEKTLKLDIDSEHHGAVHAYFSKCKKLNQEVRIVVAHGSWTAGGVRHVSRRTLEAKVLFEKPEKLLKAAEEARCLMHELFQMGAISNR